MIQFAVTEKIIKLEEKEFKKEYETLYDSGEVFIRQNKATAYQIFLACEFLLMTRTAKLQDTYLKQVSYVKSYKIKNLYEKIVECLLYENKEIKTHQLYQGSMMLIDGFDKLELQNVPVPGSFQEPETKGFVTVHTMEPVDTVKPVDSITSICLAAKEGQIEKLSKLLDEFPDDINKPAKGWTPLHYACAQNQVSSAEHLISKGANIFIKNNKEKLPLELILQKNPEAAKKLETLYFNRMASKR